MAGQWRSGLFTINDATRVLSLASKKQIIHKYFTDDSYDQFCKGKLNLDEELAQQSAPLQMPPLPSVPLAL